MATTLDTSQKVHMTVDPRDANGDSVSGTPVWDQTDTHFSDLVVAGDGLSADLIANAPGSLTVRVNLAGVPQATADFVITGVASMNLSVGTPEPK